MPALDTGAATFPEVVVHSPGEDTARVLRLTILHHPVSERIGEVADLSPLDRGRNVALGRLQPDFAPLRGAGRAAPLQDQYISRRPFTLSPVSKSLVVEPGTARGSSLTIDGEPVADGRRLRSSELQRGVVLVLARRVVLYLHYASAAVSEADNCGLVGECDALQRIRALIGPVAATDTPVLLLGESGTGKELVARAIYERSGRASSPLVTVNMGAIPPDLAAAELFGVRRGAFTGADRDKPGYFQQAHGGTLFLDEIGATVDSVQVQLLRALQSGEIQAPGGGVQQVDVRVLSATDAALDGSGADGFHTALRHRLAAFELKLPPLRERREDIGRLLRYFLGDFIDQPRFGEAVVAAQWAVLVAEFCGYRWPGNVRELRNYCQQIRLASSGDSLRIPDNILAALKRPAPPPKEPVRTAYRVATQLSEAEVREAMEEEAWEVSRAARRLNISRQSLYRRIETIPDLQVVADLSADELRRAHRRWVGDPRRAAAALRVSRTALMRRWRALELESH